VILAIDPGNKESAYVVMDEQLKPLEFGKVENHELLRLIERIEEKPYTVSYCAIEMVACYGMPVGKEVFDTCVWIGRLYQEAYNRIPRLGFIYRADVKENLCYSMKAKDGNIIQALIDRFAYGVPNKGKGTKKDPGYFYGFKADIWQAYAVGVTYADLYLT
jgi:hypothetical protein